MNRPVILPNQLIDIVLNHGFNSHTLRVSVSDLINSLEALQVELGKKTEPELRSKIRFELQKNRALLEHLYAYSHFTSRQTLDPEDLNLNLLRAQFHLEFVNPLLRLLQPNPLIEFWEDRSGHLGQCSTCQDQYEKDREEGQNLEPLDFHQDFVQTLTWIHNSIAVRYN